jgi:signal transduction histidine kinase
MLVNLLSNAVKFTPEGGTIGLDVVGDAAAQCVHLTVWDTGIGIAADDLPHVFDRFFRADKARVRAQGGTGLGLAIARWCAEVHGGRIAVQSHPGQGSVFTVTLPLAATDEDTASPASSDDSMAAPTRSLP